MKTHQDVHKFWFEDHGSEDWFGGKADFDAALAEQFSQTFHHVAQGEAFTWRETAQGRLCEILVLDQFSRQLFRGQAAAFTQDCMSLVLAQEAVAGGYDQQVDEDKRMFLYLPYMHSESLAIHDEAVRLYKALGNDWTLDFEMRHYELIKRFGRYPKRNEALGRASTPEEIAYIEESGDSMF